MYEDLAVSYFHLACNLNMDLDLTPGAFTAQILPVSCWFSAFYGANVQVN
jgi:hypothetical protein